MLFPSKASAISRDANVSKCKQLVNHSTLYLGLFVYTAIGAWVSFMCMFRVSEFFQLCSQVFQLLELPAELERLQTGQALLISKRILFISTLMNQTYRDSEEYVEVYLELK